MPNNRIGGFVWFGLVVAGWLAFLAAAASRPHSLDALHESLRALPLVVEGVAWLLAFPYALALTVWASSWADWLRLALVLVFAVGWSLAFYPWRRGGSEAKPS